MLQQMINCIVDGFLVCSESSIYERLETHTKHILVRLAHIIRLTHIEIVCAIMNDVCSIKGVKAADMRGTRIRRL